MGFRRRILGRGSGSGGGILGSFGEFGIFGKGSEGRIDSTWLLRVKLKLRLAGGH